MCVSFAHIPPPPGLYVNASLGGRRTVGEGESQARIDEENPGEIVKEKEGKEGPLKGSNENLNLQLASGPPDGAENNGNNGLPSPIKEAQQINGGTTPDGKDTAVWIIFSVFFLNETRWNKKKKELEKMNNFSQGGLAPNSILPLKKKTKILKFRLA